jgi:hypothetical protein
MFFFFRAPYNLQKKTPAYVVAYHQTGQDETLLGYQSGKKSESHFILLHGSLFSCMLTLDGSACRSAPTLLYVTAVVPSIALGSNSAATRTLFGFNRSMGLHLFASNLILSERLMVSPGS